MGEYEPEDSRKVHQGQKSGDVGNDHKTWREMEQPQNEGTKLKDDGKAQGGYGNAQNEHGTSEQDIAQDNRAKTGGEQARPAQTSNRPDERAMGDAARSLGKD